MRQRKKRSAGVLPSSVSNLVVWARPESLSALANNDPVATWPDESGGARDFTQATAGARPTYITSALNGKSVVRFSNSATADFMNSTYANTSQQLTVIFVGLFGTFTSVQRIWGMGAESSVFDNGGADHWGWFANQANGITDLVGNSSGYQMVSVVIDSLSSATSYIGKSVSATFDPRDGYDDGIVMTIGAATSGGGNPSNSDIAEFLVYNKNLSSTEINQLADYFNRKYGITV